MLVLVQDFDGGSYGEVQRHFANHFETIGGPSDMMMVAQRISATRDRIYLLLPNNNSTSFYSSFSVFDEGQLPEEASLLVGHSDGFENRFRYTRQG